MGRALRQQRLPPPVIREGCLIPARIPGPLLREKDPSCSGHRQPQAGRFARSRYLAAEEEPRYLPKGREEWNAFQLGACHRLQAPRTEPCTILHRGSRSISSESQFLVWLQTEPCRARCPLQRPVALHGLPKQTARSLRLSLKLTQLGPRERPHSSTEARTPNET